MLEFAQRHQLNLQRAYDPPYHSKDNPVERTWGILENHRNGNILDQVNTVVQFAETMTWKGQHPIVKLVTQPYATEVKLTTQAMAAVGHQRQCLPPLEVDGKQLDLGKWFIHIPYQTEPKVE